MSATTISSPFFATILRPRKGNITIWLNALWMFAGIFFLGWSASSILLAYFFETIIIGIIHIVKMLTVTYAGQAQKESGRNKKEYKEPPLSLVIFFIMHYFFFLFVQSVFLFSFMQGGDSGIKKAFHVVGNYMQVLERPDVQQAVLAIILMNVILAIRNFFLPGKYHQYTVKEMLFQPYLRIFIQQFVVILGGFFLLFGGSTGAAVVLILLRLFIDLCLQAAAQRQDIKENIIRKMSEKQTAEDAKKTESMLATFFDA